MLAFFSGRGGGSALYTVNADGSRLRRVTRVLAKDSGEGGFAFGGIARSPNGRLIAYHGQGGLHVVRPVTSANTSDWPSGDQSTDVGVPPVSAIGRTPRPVQMATASIAANRTISGIVPPFSEAVDRAASVRAVPAQVILYGARGCHLCERARLTLTSLREELAFTLDEVDITGDPDLEARYREWLPVVEIDGERAFVYFVPEGAFRRRLGAQR